MIAMKTTDYGDTEYAVSAEAIDILHTFVWVKPDTNCFYEVYLICKMAKSGAEGQNHT